FVQTDDTEAERNGVIAIERGQVHAVHVRAKGDRPAAREADGGSRRGHGIVARGAEDIDDIEAARAAVDGGRRDAAEIERRATAGAEGAAASAGWTDGRGVVGAGAVDRERVAAGQSLVDDLFGAARRRGERECRERGGKREGERGDGNGRRVGRVADDCRV